jgi:hypothetical protein
MGALAASDLLGFDSLLVENDVHYDVASSDPAGNHIAIMFSGNTAHSTTLGGNGYTTSACDGSAQGCLYSPANTFEESPPLPHNQRIEIHTGCDSTCGTCNSGGPNSQVKVWTDCASCSDTASDFVATMPKASRCIALDPAMGTFYFGFTGGFSTTGGGQGVTIRNLDLQTQ